jgi:hypothetical protein
MLVRGPAVGLVCHLDREQLLFLFLQICSYTLHNHCRFASAYTFDQLILVVFELGRVE